MVVTDAKGNAVVGTSTLNTLYVLSKIISYK